ncbi:hypothetical protein D3C80_1267640 [compost metagenome]
MGDIEFGVQGTDGMRLPQIADQANRLARYPQANGDFGANRDTLDVIAKGLAAQPGRFMPAVVPDLGTHQAGTDGDFRFARALTVHRSASDLNLYK